MSFFEVQFPTNISIGAVGGPEFSTHIVAIDSGYEQRNQRWDTCRLRYDVSHGVRTIEEMKQLVSFFRMVKGKAHGFRFKDYTDYTVGVTEGRFAKNVADAVPNIYASGEKTYQLYKTYDFSSNFTHRLINKPVAGSVKVFVNGVESTDFSLNTTTGLLTWNDTSGTTTTLNSLSYNISGITLGATTTVTTSVTHAVAAGDRIYLSGIGGTTQLNNLYFTVTSVTGTTIILSVNSTAYGAFTSGGTVQRHAITSEAVPTVHWAAHGLANGNFIHLKTTSPGWTSSKLVKSYLVSGVSTNRFSLAVEASTEPKVTTSVQFTKFFTTATELTWSGQFDVPCRFDTDYMAAVSQSSIHGSWESIPLVEIRQ